MFSITKDFTFAAAHHLYDLPEEHQCSRLHGHNYIVRVKIDDAKTDDVGFVIDYGELKPIREYLDTHLDHRNLNDVLPALGGPRQPSAELMAKWLTDIIRTVVPQIRQTSTISVGVSETANSWAWYTEA